MSYVIQNYFFPPHSLYFSPKIKFLIFLKSTHLIFCLLKNNFFFKNMQLFLYFSWSDFKIFKKFFFSQNLMFFYKHFLLFKYKLFNHFTESCFFLNLLNLHFYLNFNIKNISFKNFKFFTNSLQYNSYYFHTYAAPFNFKKNSYTKFFFYFISSNNLMWPSLYNLFNTKKHFFLINNDFFLNFYYNTYFFNIYKF